MEQQRFSFYNLARYEEVIKHFDKAIEQKPDYADAWNNKGNALNDLTRYEELIKCYDKVIERNPKNTKAWDNKGSALYNLAKYEEAIPNTLTKP